jgi:hypothetical protein
MRSKLECPLEKCMTGCAHQSAHKMRWMLKRVGFYWPSLEEDCFRYFRGCEACQRFGDVQLAPASMLHLVVKPWPFRRWGLYFIREIHPSSSKGHRFVLVAIDYFTKWTESCTPEEYDPQGSDKLHARTHSALIWITTNINY